MKSQKNKALVKFFLVNLGCAKNLVDSESMIYELCSGGKFAITTCEEEADLIIINTCCFIEAAKEESINIILEYVQKKKKHHFKILAGGCLPQRYREEIRRLIPEVDGWFGTDRYADIARLVEKMAAGENVWDIESPPQSFTEYRGRVGVTPSHWSYVKIAEGCAHHCTFCIIPSIKGSYRSRSMEAIAGEVTSLAARGCREISLIAQDTSLYGTDLYGRKSLPELLDLLGDIEGIEWIRILYLYPRSIDEKLIETIASHPKIVKYLDIPLQHASGRILKEMGRAWSREENSRLLRHLREKIPGLVLRSSFIVGFPGESDKEFEELAAFLRDNRLNRAGFFEYSREENTEAAGYGFQVPASIKHRRLAKVTLVQKKVSQQLNEERMHTTIPVMVDKVKEPGEVWKGIFPQLGNLYGGNSMEKEIACVGRSSWDAPEIDGLVLVKKAKESERALSPGDIVQVKITKVSAFDAVGELQW